jgi:hypothetical protein
MLPDITTSRASQIWRIAEAAAAVSGVGTLLASAQLWMHYAYTRPTQPIVFTGAVYALNTHGSVVYLTGREHFLLDLLMIVGGASFAGAVVIDIVKRPFQKNGS